MKIAISMKQDADNYGAERSILEDAYSDYFRRFGVMLFPVSNSTSDVSLYLREAQIEGIILSGGNDVDPLMYGGWRTEGLSLALKRDRIEKAMLEYAISHHLPVLGICRGMQFLNAYHGGKIIDLRNESISHPAGKDRPHEIRLLRYEEVLGAKARVNSYHNQGLRKEELSPQLQAFAVAGEVIEGFYHHNLPIVGVQWHPERKSPDEMFNEKLIKAFVKGDLWWKR